MSFVEDLIYNIKNCPEVSIPQNKEISHDDINIIIEILKENGITTASSADFEKIGREWLITEGDFCGTLPKRIRKFYKLDSKVAGIIGNTISELLPPRIQDTYLYISRKFDWYPGEFGDGGSCFWGSRSDAKIFLEEAGVIIFKLYENSDPIARCLSLPYNDYLFIFNCYAVPNYSVKLVTFARILATISGGLYDFINLSINDSTEDPVFINGGGKSYWIGNEEFNAKEINLIFGEEE